MDNNIYVNVTPEVRELAVWCMRLACVYFVFGIVDDILFWFRSRE